MRSDFLNGFFDSIYFMGTQIIHNDDISCMKSWCKMLFNVFLKNFAIKRTGKNRGTVVPSVRTEETIVVVLPVFSGV